MTELPSRSHKSREPREVVPVTRNPGRVRKQPVSRKFMETFIQGNARDVWSSMIWQTFFPNLRDNVADAVHDGIDMLFSGNGNSGGYRRGPRRHTGNNITRHNPDKALGGHAPERFSRDDRRNHNLGTIEIDSRAEAEEVLNSMNATIDQYDLVSLAEFYQLVQISPETTDFGWGWEDLGGAKIIASRGSYYLDLPSPIKIK